MIFMKTIKRILLAGALFLVISSQAIAQRIATVDVTVVLESLSDYKAAQAELDQVSAQWRRQISEKYDKIKGLYNKYQAEQVLMSEEMRTQKEEEIMAREKEVREMQKDKFGPEGALFQKRRDLVQPIQDRVYGVIEDFANDKGYDFILDKSSTAGLIFANERYDKTDEIMAALK